MENIMKKLGKLFAILAVLICAVCVFAFAVSASDEGEHSEAFKAVDAEGTATYTNTWADAVRAAVGGTVYLNKDHTLTNSLTEVKETNGYLDIRFDLNGHKLTATSDCKYGAFFLDARGYSFELVGDGEIVLESGVTQVVYVTAKSGNASPSPLTVKIRGIGNGIRVSLQNINAAGTFKFDDKASSEISGDITVTPEATNNSGYLFAVGATNGAATTHNFLGARITVKPPKNYKYNTYINCFIRVGDNTTVNIKDHSVINMEHGNGFDFIGAAGYIGKSGNDTNGTVTSESAKVTGIAEVSSVTAINKWVNLKDSTFAAETQLTRTKEGLGAGRLFTVGNSAVEIRAEDCDLVGAVRAIYGWTNRGVEALPAAKLYFKNVNYTTSDNVQYNSPWLTAERINLLWDGGVITLKTANYSNQKVMTIKADTVLDEATNTLADGKVNEYCFGETALGLLRDANNDQTINFTNDTVLATATKYLGADGNYYGSAAEATKKGTTIDETQKYTRYEYYLTHGSKAFYQVSGDAYRYSEVSYTVNGETVNDWFGLGFRNVLFVNGISPSVNTMGASKNNYEALGSQLTNQGVLGANGELITGTMVGGSEYGDAMRNGDNALLSRLTDVYNPTTSNYNGKCFSKSTTYGASEVVTSTNGSNGYIKLTLDKSNYKESGQMYLDLNLGGYLGWGAEANSVSVAANDYRYVVQEFDVKTATGIYPESTSSGAAFIARYQAPIFEETTAEDGTVTQSVKKNASGTYVGGTSYTANYQVQSVYSFFQIAKDGTLSFNSKNKYTDETVKLPTDGSWARFTVVYELSRTEETYVPSGCTKARACYKYNGTAHIYLDGEWIVDGYIGFKDIDKEYSGTFGLDALRLWFANTVNEGETRTICVDNTRVVYPTSSADVKELDELFAGDKLPANIEGNSLFMQMPDNNALYNTDDTPKASVGTVDGRSFTSAEALCAAIDNGSLVELKADLAAPIVCGGKNITVLTNGHEFGGIVSETHRVFKTELADGARHDAVPAMSYEKISVALNGGDQFTEISGTMTAAIGTRVVIPEVYLPENLTGKLVGNVIYSVDAWSFDADGNAVTLVLDEKYVTSGAATVYALVATSNEVATVIWKDWNGNEVHKDYYVPNDAKLPVVYDGETIAHETVDGGEGWYDRGFGGWNEVLTTVGEAKEYVYTAKSALILDVQGIKLNLSVYTDFELNVYIPNTLPAGVQSAVLARNAAGTTLVKPTDVGLNDSNEYYAPHEVTITGMTGTYMKYVDRYATADTTITKYYLVVTTTEGETLVQEIEYGVPFYAVQAMTSDVDNMTFEARALVMNMVNYVDRVLTLSGEKRDKGGELYAEIMRRYKDTGEGEGEDARKYLEAFTSLTDAAFTSGDIYTNDVATLTYKDAAGYIAGASMLFTTGTPTFVLEYGPRAISAANGIKAPNNNNTYGWGNLGSGVYFNYASDRGTPAKHYAFVGDVYKGGTLITSGNVWGTNSAQVVDAEGKEVAFDFAQGKYFYADGGAEYTGEESALKVATINGVGDVKYYAFLDSYRYQQKVDEEGKLEGKTSFSKVYDLLEPVTVTCYYMYKEGSDTKWSDKPQVTYSLAGYINGMIALRDADNGANYDEYAQYVDVAKALYAYASAAKDFVG